MDLTRARPGDAIELPEGVFALASVTHFRATALDWSIWELAPDEQETVPEATAQSPAGSGPRPVLLALIDTKPYRAQLDETETLPDDAELTINHMIYRLRHRGEARAERASQDGQHDFWIGQYRHYEREGVPLILSDQRGRITRLTGEPMDERVISIFA